MTVVGLLALTVLLVAVGAGPGTAGRRAPDEAQARVDHHLRQAEPLLRHFRALLDTGCPRLASRAEWDAYVDAEVDRVVLLLARLGEAWTEARQTGDDDVRRSAKAPRKQFQRDAPELLRQLQACAAAHGTTVPTTLRVRVESEVPQRRAEIALPQ